MTNRSSFFGALVVLATLSWIQPAGAQKAEVHSRTIGPDSTASIALPMQDRLALEQALNRTRSFGDINAAATWMSTMGSRIEKELPNPFERFELLRLVHREATATGLDPQLVLALISVESDFDRFAVSKSGARGLMQIMPFWIKEIGHPTDDLFETQTNLGYGCHILKRYLLLANEDKADALMRYNGGSDPLYSRKVLQALNQRFN